MNYLGLDYGEKRMGLAKADSETRVATPLSTILNDREAVSKILEIIDRENVEVVVIGVPMSFDGGENNFAKKIRRFGEEIEKLSSKKVEFENEIFSSKIAGRDSEKVDESAAAIILQSFLDKTKI